VRENSVSKEKFKEGKFRKGKISEGSTERAKEALSPTRWQYQSQV
jgi:hypothetical protein